MIDESAEFQGHPLRFQMTQMTSPNAWRQEMLKNERHHPVTDTNLRWQMRSGHVRLHSAGALSAAAEQRFTDLDGSETCRSQRQGLGVTGQSCLVVWNIDFIFHMLVTNSYFYFFRGIETTQPGGLRWITDKGMHPFPRCNVLGFEEIKLGNLMSDSEAVIVILDQLARPSASCAREFAQLGMGAPCGSLSSRI